jgi:hypothetical protein
VILKLMSAWPVPKSIPGFRVLLEVRTARWIAALACALLAVCAWVSPAFANSPQFGISKFTMSATNQAGESFTQAGGHPYALKTTIEFNSEELPETKRVVPVQDPKDVAVDLPPGLLGDPQAVPHCSLTIFDASVASVAHCPPSTQVGTILLHLYGGEEFLDSVYNLTPPPGTPAELGLTTPQGVHFVFSGGVRTGEGYGIRTIDSGIVMAELTSAELTLWGTPADPSHDRLRGLDCVGEEAGQCLLCSSEIPPEFCQGGNHSSGDPILPFVTLPTDCAAGATTASVASDSWESPGSFNTDGSPNLGDPNWKNKTTTLPAVTGCNLLAFDPKVSLEPETTKTDTPDGFHFGIDVPQTESPGLSATPEVRDVTVTLPAGMSLSPAAADGLQACSDAQFAVSSSAPANCPAASQVATVKVQTPLLPNPLNGQVFLAEPGCASPAHPAPCEAADAEDGSLFHIFLQAQGSGVTVKLPGKVEVGDGGPHSLHLGQVRTSFAESPQLPFSALDLEVKGGPRAPFANPQNCGEARTTSDLTPWSAPGRIPGGEEVLGTPDARPFSFFEVGGCATSMPFQPSFAAGTVTPLAGGYSPFTMALSRQDGEQDLSGVTLSTPPGLLGKIAEVPLCGEPQAKEGACPSSSRIGTVAAGAGAGSHPFWLSGAVYLTGPYKGAPYGLSIVIPTKAGPFDLGNEIVRAAVGVDPHTTALTVTSDPLPQSKDGVPFRVKKIQVTIDRPSFIFNPTNCEAQHITVTIAGAQPSETAGTNASLSSPFAVTQCASLPFKPSFVVSTQAKASRNGNGASLDVKVTSKGGPGYKAGEGEANIHEVKVTLPRQLPARLTTLREACIAAQFEQNPAGCPAASDVGTAVAHTPVLSAALTGPAYLVSYGGAAFPDLEIILQGEGVTVVLDGHTKIKKGITTSAFQSVPDVPVSSFELKLPENRHSVFASPGGNLCGADLLMPTHIVGQNGATLDQNTRIHVTECSPRKFEVSGQKIRGRSVVFTVSVPGAGQLTGSGASVQRVSKSTARTGTVSLSLRLKGRKGHSRVKITFTPASGHKQTKTRTITTR